MVLMHTLLLLTLLSTPLMLQMGLMIVLLLTFPIQAFCPHTADTTVEASIYAPITYVKRNVCIYIYVYTHI